MAKKIGTMAMATIIGFFILGSLGSFLFEADKVTFSNTNKVGEDLLNIGESGTAETRLTEVSLQQNTFESGSFTLPEERLVETRGISQGNIMSKDSPATIKKSLTDFGEKYKIGAGEIALLISLIVLTGIVLLARVFRGEGAI
jgi:hypothetical protein